MTEHQTPPEPANLRFLRRLVTVLTATMILGIAAVVVLMALRLQAPSRPLLPDEVSLDPGISAVAFTQGQGWYAVVTSDDRILIYDAQTQALRQEIQVTSGE